MTDVGFDLRWTVDDVLRATVFEPHDRDWIRVEFEWTGEEWHELERERVTEVACFGRSGECIAPDGPLPRPVDEDGCENGRPEGEDDA